jgi:hypothetical protein
MLAVAGPRGRRTTLQTERAREAIVSWNSRAAQGLIELAIHRSDGQISTWLPYVEWNARERRSLSGHDEVASCDIDIVRSPRDIVAIDVRSDTDIDWLAVSTARFAPQQLRSRPVRDSVLHVPPRRQYLDEFPNEHGWCSPASTSMLLAYWGFTCDVPTVAKGVRDDAYGGTGNWAFNVAFIAAFGLSAAVVQFRDLAHASRFIEAGIPIATSYSWRKGELTRAPLEESVGHLGVLCGFDANGDPVLNDPAHMAVQIAYPAAEFERAWIGHGGIGYVATPPDRADSILRLANS